MSGKKIKRLKRVDLARNALEDALLDALQLVEAFEALAGEEVPPWLWTVSSRVQHVQDAAHGYMEAVHAFARPALDIREQPHVG